MKKGLLYSVILLLAGLVACIEKPTYPTEPVIGYKDFIKYGSDPSNPDSVDLVITFTDNEGDIGLEQGDTVGIFKYGNIWLEYYYDSVSNGNHYWAAFDSSIQNTVPFDTFRFGYRIPPVLPEGDPAEPMKGQIYVKQSPFIKVHDRIKYVVFMYDRALHRSDTIHTPPIQF